MDIDAGNALVERIKPLAKATMRSEAIGALGGFGGLTSLPAGMRDPVLVSGTDGVGTKLKTAFATGRHKTIGIDLVAMCVNDIIVSGATPLLFLDYFATGKLSVDLAEDVISGIAEGCKQSHCSLLGGETAELPGMYQEGEYDLAGFCVGVVERAEIRDASSLRPGDVVIGLASTGLHSNGHSLARRALLDKLGLNFDAQVSNGDQSLADALLEPTRIYVDALGPLDGKRGPKFKAASHITGGGLIENPPRMFSSQDLALSFDLGSWVEPPIFSLLRQAEISEFEMRRTFNLGLGMLVVVEPGDEDTALKQLSGAGYRASIVGELIPRSGDAVEFKSA